MWTRLVVFFVDGRGLLGGWIVEGLRWVVKEEEGELVVEGCCWWWWEVDEVDWKATTRWKSSSRRVMVRVRGRDMNDGEG